MSPSNSTKISFKMKLPLMIAVAIGMVLPMLALADSPATPYAWMVTNEYRNFIFKMVPSRWKFDGDKEELIREPFGVAYKISENGDFEEFWRTEGWYTFHGYLSEDGQYFVRFGPWANDQENHTDLAIAFYERGKLIREYQVKELIRKPELLQYSVSHYRWTPAKQSKPNGFYGETFHLVMIDKTTYSFDYKSGQIINRTKDKGAKSSNEIWAEEQDAAAKKGKKLFETCSLKENFQRSFEMIGIQAVNGIPSGWSLEGNVWSAGLTPKEKLKHPVSIDILLPIVDDKRLGASVTPTDILSAIKFAFDHPFIAKRFSEGGAVGMRMRTQGERLHQDTAKLINSIEKITGEKPEEKALNHWAYFIIDAEAPRYTSLYLNTKTGEVILEDSSKWPNEPYLLDAAGNHQESKTKTHE